MIYKKSILGIKSARIVLDDEAALREARDGAYGRLEILSHNHLDLPGFVVQEKMTGLIDLSVSLEEVLSRFNKTTRNEIARTFSDPLYAFQRFENIPPDLYRLYYDFERHLGHEVPFSLQALNGCIAFGAYYDGQLIAGIIAFPSAPIARVRAIFSARYDGADKHVSFASRRLVYEICRWGIGAGRVAIDLARVNPEAPNFKMSFNPRVIPEYVYRKTTGLYAALEKARIVVRNIFRI